MKNHITKRISFITREIFKSRLVVLILIVLLSDGCSSNNKNEQLLSEFEIIKDFNTYIRSYSGYIKIDFDPEHELDTSSGIVLQMAGINMNEETQQYKVYSKIFSTSNDDKEIFATITGYNMTVNEVNNYDLPIYFSSADIFSGMDFELDDITSISSSGYINGSTVYIVKLKSSIHNQFLQDFADTVYPELGVNNVSFTDIQYLISVDKEKYIRETSVTFDLYCDLDDAYFQGKLMVKRTFDNINEINDLDDIVFYASRDIDPDNE